MHTRNSSSKQLLQIVSEQQFVAGDLEARPKEESPSEAMEHLIWQRVLAGSAPLCSHHLHNTCSEAIDQPVLLAHMPVDTSPVQGLQAMRANALL